MLSNAKNFPIRLYGLHFHQGVAEYSDPSSSKPYRILVNAEAAKEMDESFQGKPVYVLHVDEVDLKNIQMEADGYVVKSFYNKADGNHWVEFLLVSDRGQEAYRRGYRLSNAYFPQLVDKKGLWHGVEYSKEVVSGQYEHLALVDDPRYNESIILTPEEFKQYNHEKEIELQKLANSKGDKSMAFKFFKKAKVENALDLENTLVELPLSKREMSINEALHAYDKMLNMHGYAHDDHMVKLNDDDEMSVKELRDAYCSAMEEKKAMHDEEIEEPKGGSELGEEDEPEMYHDDDDSDMHHNDEESEEEEGRHGKGSEKDFEDPKEEKAEKGDKTKKQNVRGRTQPHGSNYKKLNRAHHKTVNTTEAQIFTSRLGMEVGRSRYGSGK